MRYAIRILCLLAIALLTGCGVPSFLITPVQNVSKLQEIQVQKGKGFLPPKIAIIEVEGVLANLRMGGFLQPTENPLSLFTQQLQEAQDDPSVRAIVLRINSPGGTVTTADTMYQQILAFRKKTHKPVIASTQEVAASGAYYLACAADRIVAHPTSVVGSIGVIFHTFDFEGTMMKIGMRSEVVKSGPLKDMASPFRHMTPEERAVLQDLVNEHYARFLSVVTTNRTIRKSDLKTATDGRIFSGRRAVELGLADQTGQLDDALDLARQLANVPDAKVIMYKRPHGYSGSIYADLATPPPRADVLKLSLPGERALLPSGFYYLWEP